MEQPAGIVLQHPGFSGNRQRLERRPVDYVLGYGRIAVGYIGVGKRQWKFGTGLQYDGGDGLTTESLVLNAPYGPLDIGIGFYPHRPARRGQTITIDPYDLLVSSVFSGRGISTMRTRAA